MAESTRHARTKTRHVALPSCLPVVAAAVAGIAALAACAARTAEQLEPAPHDAKKRFPTQTFEDDVDLLFVIDNSASMFSAQQKLALGFPKLIDALRSEQFGPDGSGKPCNADQREGCSIPSLHIGVVSTDLGAGDTTTLPSCEVPGGDGGRLQSTPQTYDCTPPSTKPYISFLLGFTNIPGATGDSIHAVERAFDCIVKLGDAGCGYEQPLEAARRALDPTLNVNAGFRRDGALLVVVFLGDEDDCSVRDPQLFAQTQPALSDPLGPLTSFRCFEFGVTCDVNDRTVEGPRTGCVPSDALLHSVPQRYADFFRAIAPPRRVILAAFVGPTDRVEVTHVGGKPMLKESCVSAAGVALPAIRIASLIDTFAPDSQLTSLCEPDFERALAALGGKILRKLEPQCFPNPLLTANGGLACRGGDAYGPGLVCAQDCLHLASCDVIEIVAQGTAQERTFKIERCPTELWYPGDWKKDRDCGAHCPCWRIVRKEPADCGPAVNGSPYGLDVLRAPGAGSRGVVESRCFTSPAKWGVDVEALAQLSQCE